MPGTYIMFIDASGDPGPYNGSNTKYYVLAGLIVKPENWYTAYNGALNILKQFFPQTSMLKRPELHYHDIRRGKGIYGRLTNRQKKDLVDKVFGLITSIDPTIISIVVDKIRYFKKYRKPEPIKKISFQYLMDRYEKFLGRRRAYGLLVYDYEGKQDKNIRLVLEQSRLIGSINHIWQTLWKYHRIIETIFFTESETSIGLQLVDFVAYAIFNCYEHNKCNRHNQILPKFDKGPNGRIYGYGIKVIP